MMETMLRQFDESVGQIVDKFSRLTPMTKIVLLAVCSCLVALAVSTRFMYLWRQL